MTTTTVHGLYAITDANLMPAAHFADLAEQALAGGAKVLQYRDKSTDHTKRLAQAQNLHQLCVQYGMPLIINDDVELCAQVGAEGVHLGEDDVDFVQARQRLGEKVIIGVSCYNNLARAQCMRAAGADYVAFGSFFPSTIKPQARVAKIDLLRQAKQQLDCPIVAIGGITAQNGAALCEAGADALAVISAVFGAEDVATAARAFTGLCSSV